jgi:superfamily II DNA/RNA helicase
MSFSELGLAEPVTRALAEERYLAPTPIQAAAIPVVLAGLDLIAIAQTGTGKTAAFALPILNLLLASPSAPERKRCRVLVLSPTRELAAQIGDAFRTYGRHASISVATVIGGVSMGKQIAALRAGVDVLIATPGRLLDLVQSRAVVLDGVARLVLDEADRMLDMGFVREVRKIAALLPRRRQTLLFSATMPDGIAHLARDMLIDPQTVSVAPQGTPVERVAQRALHVARRDKPGLLAKLLKGEPIDRAIVFARTKHGADRVVRDLARAGIDAAAIHGNKSQSQRERALCEFRSGRVTTLVATDIAARGIDVDGVSHVVNYDLPEAPESYVHRIGRTARAGNSGVAISFCHPEEIPYLRAIEKLTRQQIPADAYGDRLAAVTTRPVADAPRGRRRRAQQRPRFKSAGGARR